MEVLFISNGSYIDPMETVLIWNEHFIDFQWKLLSMEVTFNGSYIDFNGSYINFQWKLHRFKWKLYRFQWKFINFQWNFYWFPMEVILISNESYIDSNGRYIDFQWKLYRCQWKLYWFPMSPKIFSQLATFHGWRKWQVS